MSTKRLHDEVEGAGSSDGFSKPSFKRQKKYGPMRKHKAKEGSLEYAKKRIRNIERLFQRHVDLPSDVRNELERELKAHQITVSDNRFQKRRSAMISKYHMVRFFDRRKAMRLVKQLRRSIAEADDAAEIERLRHDLHIAEVDETYALYHPHAEPYINLYGSSKSSAKDEEDNDGRSKTPRAKVVLSAERPPLWKEVEEAMEQGPGALRALRERRSANEDIVAPTMTQKANNSVSEAAQSVSTEKEVAPARKPLLRQTKDSKQALNRRERRKLMREVSEKEKREDEGDGFFDF